MDQDTPPTITGLVYDGTHMEALAQYTITQKGLGIGASFYVDIRTEKITEELLREKMGAKISEFMIL